MLFIGTPLYDNRVCSQYLHGLVQTIDVLRSHGLPSEYALEQGTYIAINREKLVRRFLKSQCQFFLFIDSDTAFTPLDVLALLSSDVDVVSGLYRYRVQVQPSVTPHCFRDLNGEPIDVNSPDLQECEFVPTGMLLIRRSVFEKLYESYEYLFNQGFHGKSVLRHKPQTTDEVILKFEGEDEYFSRIWREAGGKVHVNCNVKVGHIGERDYRIGASEDRTPGTYLGELHYLGEFHGIKPGTRIPT
jgi:hypothetical protein